MVKEETQVNCILCGASVPLNDAEPMFTGRAKYVCAECLRNGNRQVTARRREFRASARGKSIIAICERNK